MEGEFNSLTTKNAEVTFSTSTNNTATSDELTAALMYQDKMGTNYSKGKAAVRMINITGITLILTAAAIKTGNFIANVYIVNPPTISNETYEVKDNVFSYSFEVANENKYSVKYYLLVNNKTIIEGECSASDTYSGSYEGLKTNDKLNFYVQFSNRFDYKKIISDYTYKVE